MCACECVRERVCVFECVCLRARECMYVCVCVCVCERERMFVYVLSHISIITHKNTTHAVSGEKL